MSFILWYFSKVNVQRVGSGKDEGDEEAGEAGEAGGEELLIIDQ
ncbi:MAG: hypothetical protein V7K32_17100 [Nostoc sp.]